MFSSLLNVLRFPGEKENSLKTDDYGRDLSSVQTLLTKQVSADAAFHLKVIKETGQRFSNTRFWYSHILFLFNNSYVILHIFLCKIFLFLMLQETFDAGLQAFQQEGIANITALKDQLLAAKHIQSKAIEARHASLMKRWNQLLANSAARKKKLLEAQEHFRKVSHQTLELQKSDCSFWRKSSTRLGTWAAFLFAANDYGDPEDLKVFYILARNE